MVQVDVFWSYALGASFASAAARQIQSEARDGKPTFQSPYFVRLLLFLSILFVPSGVCLLWMVPGWETMFAGDRNLPGWLVTLFCATNVTQGILGYWVAQKLIERGNLYWAHLQWVFGYFMLFFILVHGWDGTGWHRFFYGGTIEEWRAGVEYSKWAFVGSTPARILYTFGLMILPVLFYWKSAWVREGYALADLDTKQVRASTRGSIVRLYVRTLFVYTLGSAILASILVHLLGWLIGLAAFAGLFYVFGIRSGGVFHRQIHRITLDPGSARLSPTAGLSPAREGAEA